MTGRVDARLAELGVTLPDAPAPAAAYVPTVRTGNLLFVSGQVPIEDGALVKGRCGDDFTTEQGKAAARICALFIAAQLRKACDGDLDRVVRIVKLTGFVNSAPDFGEQPAVINGASETLAEIFGPEVGAHARSAVGMAALPFGVAVEVEAIAEIR